MEIILNWLESCGYTKADAVNEAEIMIKRNMYQSGVQVCSREYAIEMILEDLVD